MSEVRGDIIPDPPNPSGRPPEPPAATTIRIADGRTTDALLDAIRDALLCAYEEVDSETSLAAVEEVRRRHA